MDLDGFENILLDMLNFWGEGIKEGESHHYATRSILVVYGMYVTILNLSAFWNRLQGTDFNDSRFDSMVKLPSTIKGFNCFKR